MQRRWAGATALAAMVLLGAATVGGEPAPLPFVASQCTVAPGAGYAVSGYRPVPVAAPPYTRTEATALDLDDPRYDIGPDGVLRQPWDGHPDGVYHPVNLEWYALDALESYRATGRPALLDRAIANAEALRAGAETDAAGALWFPYRFDHRLHGDDAMAMDPPWYSGMAQGMGLSLFVRLAEVTGEPAWREAADAAFLSFAADNAHGEPGFRLEDDNGCLWFEEYVDDRIEPVHVVNGHIYALFGLYDYALASGNPDAIAMFDGGATTVRESFASFRVPGGTSLYCASAYCARAHWTPESYHRGVAAQLDALAQMSGDSTFAEMARTLRQDAG